MAECKNCGTWFSSTLPSELCPTCRRALDRLKGYVAPVRHGRWFEMVESIHDTHTGEYYDEVYYNCDRCDYAADEKTPFCPNCGAYMGGADNG